MANAEGLAYRMYEEYYSRAREAFRSTRPAEAKALFLHAAEQLLLAAKEAGGDTRKALIKRSEKLIQLSDSIPQAVVQPTAPPPSSTPKAGQGKQTTGSPGDESETDWIPSERPNVRFEDIAGLADVKDSINTRVILPRKFPDVYKAFKRSLNSGILLYGPPGTGKTMIAKAIATEVNAPFYAVRCSDIVGKYFGEAEKNVKRLFETARAQPSAVLFFDEFEALAAKRGGNSTVMNRLVPELLSQIDGFTANAEKNLLLLAATNRPWDLDTAFLRPPRLTEKIFVGLPDAPAREYLIKRKLEEIPCAPDLDVDEITRLTDGFNAADVAEFCESMKDGAIKRSIGSAGVMSPISKIDMDYAAERIRSSVQASDLASIAKWEATQK